MNSGNWNNEQYKSTCGNGDLWYGYGGDRRITTKLEGDGCAKLTYGNCFKASTSWARVLLNGSEISRQNRFGNESIQFYYTDGQLLELEQTMSILLFVSFEKC